MHSEWLLIRNKHYYIDVSKRSLFLEYIIVVLLLISPIGKFCFIVASYIGIIIVVVLVYLFHVYVMCRITCPCPQ